jgi:DNA-binding NtrC family response regulator
MRGREPKLLIVDDERDTCTNLADIFGDLGYDVRVAYDGPSALRLAERNSFDIALLDLKMPGMDGVELFKRLKDVSQGTAAIIITAYAASDTAREAMDAGAWGLMAKPVDVQALFRTIEEALGQPVVLVVDDDHELCESLRDVLLQKRYRVCVAHDVPGGQQQLKRQDFQVVLLDLKLPTGSGTDLLQSVQKESPTARTIIITGHRSDVEQTINAALASGANAVCYKPFDVPRLLRMIESLSTQSAK